MEEAAPVDQSPQERPRGSSTDSTSTLPYSYDVSKPSSPCSSSVVLTLNSPSVTPSVITPSDIPIKVEYLSDPISIPPPLFHLQDYSSSSSAPCYSSISTSHVPSVMVNPVSTIPSGQDVPYSVPLFRPSPIGFFSMTSQYLTDPSPSSFLSLDILPPLSSPITHDQDLPSCSFVPSKVIPASVSTLPLSHNTPSSKKPRSGHHVRGKSSRGRSFKGKFPRGQGKGSRPLSEHSPHLISSSQNLSSSQPPILPQGHPPGVRALDLSTKHRVSSYLPQIPTINPFFTNYSCSPKVFSPIVSFNKPSEYVFNMFSFIYINDFFPGQDNRSL